MLSMYIVVICAVIAAFIAGYSMAESRYKDILMDIQNAVIKKLAKDHNDFGEVLKATYEYEDMMKKKM